MSNTATARTPIKLYKTIYNQGYSNEVIPITLLYDTPSGLLTLKSAVAGSKILLCGIEAMTELAGTLTFYSNATEIQAYPLSPNGGRAEPLNLNNPVVITNTEPGEALNMSCTTAIGYSTLYVMVV